MKLPFLNCRGSMCDPEIQEKVFAELLVEKPKNRVDMWFEVSTDEGRYDANAYGDLYGAPEGYINVVLHPVYKQDNTYCTEYGNVVGRASISERDLTPFWVGGKKVECPWTVWVGGVEVNDGVLTYEEARRIAFEYEEKGYDDVVIQGVA